MALLAMGYVAVCVLVGVRQRDLMYFPGLTRTSATGTDLTLVVDDVRLRAWVVNPGRTHGLVYFGGNAEAVQQHRATFSHWFPGHTVYLPAYRGYGASEGTPSEAALKQDALAFFDHAADRHQSVDIIGRSLGSGVAAHVASRRPVERLALVTPFDSMVTVARHHYPWLPVDWLIQDRFDSARPLARFEGEVQVVRAEHDEVVPAHSTRRLIDALPRASTTVVTLAGAGHNTVDADPAYGAALQALMRRDARAR
ncbi:alpha/beta hydrolase [Lysobacter sp. 13A]|uniref:Alpha/beta hydrolase n=2 Tax=Novilysobacter selenitireducens TaxID=2872639 RepID=A0ABS7T5I6_9GAMM|nr:alpha/beta hydrolase [Lysobacter selenitireducens]